MVANYQKKSVGSIKALFTENPQPTLWKQVQEIVYKNDDKEKQQTEKRLSFGHPFKGILRLDTGEAFSPSGTKGIRNYVSQRAIKLG